MASEPASCEGWIHPQRLPPISYALRQSFPTVLDEELRMGNEMDAQHREIVRCLEDRTLEVSGDCSGGHLLTWPAMPPSRDVTSREQLDVLRERYNTLLLRRVPRDQIEIGRAYVIHARTHGLVREFLRGVFIETLWLESHSPARDI